MIPASQAQWSTGRNANMIPPEHMVCDEQLDDLEDALSSGLVRVCDAGRIKCLWTRA